jgi:UDP-3-O-[3-hydroxymyristoyl] glucosamine N-acyltransferase
LINSSAKIKQGSVIYPGCIIDKNVTIGRNVLLNLGVTVAHDTSIGDNSFLAPRVAIQVLLM